MGVITIGAKDFVKGVSTSDDLPDGGYSPKTKGQSPKSSVGSMAGKSLGQDRSTNLVNNKPIIAGVRDGLGTGEMYFVTDDGATGGTYFSWSGEVSNMTLDVTDATTNEYLIGRTDMKFYNGALYTTTHNDVTLGTLAGGVISAVDKTWWSATAGTGNLAGSYPHPMIIFDGKLWIADTTTSTSLIGSLYSWDGTTGIEDVITLGYGNTITALGRYESTGDMLIGVDSNANMNAVQSYTSKILIWDGFSPVINREIITTERITAFYNLGGVTYVFYGRNLGYFNGNGITFLRELNINYSSDELIYPNKVTDANDTLYIAENDSILAFGKIYSGGSKVFYYPYRNSDTAQFDVINHFGNDSNSTFIATTYKETSGNDTKLNYIDLDTADIGTLETNKYYLPSNSKIRKIEVTVKTLTAGQVYNINVYNSASPSSAANVGTLTFSGDGAISQKTFRGFDIETAYIQLQISIPALGEIRQVKVYYDPIEKPV